MVTIHLHQTTTATPGQFLTGLTDCITMTTTDSNAWGGRSAHTYTLTPRPDGTTDVDAVVIREGKNLKGRLLEIGVRIFGKRFLGQALAKTAKAIEARNSQTTPGNS